MKPRSLFTAAQAFLAWMSPTASVDEVNRQQTVESLYTGNGNLKMLPAPFKTLMQDYVGLKGDRAIEKRVQVAYDAARDNDPNPLQRGGERGTTGSHIDGSTSRRSFFHCIRTGGFMDLRLKSNPWYEKFVLDAMTTADGAKDQVFMDIGATFAVDSRQLLLDGRDKGQDDGMAERVYASEINDLFVDVSADLFKGEPDASTVKDNFLKSADLLDTSHPRKFSLGNGFHGHENKFTILHLSAVFHLFSKDDQMKVIRSCMKLLKKDKGKPVLVIGGQRGGVVAKKTPGEEATEEAKEAEDVKKECTRKGRCGGGWRKNLKHDAFSWAEMWREAIVDSDFRADVETRAVLQSRKRNMETGLMEYKDIDPEKYKAMSPEEQRAQSAWLYYANWITFDE